MSHATDDRLWVKWTDVTWPPESMVEPEDYKPIAFHYAGEIIGTVRAFGETRLVVALDSGELKEVPIQRVQIIRKMKVRARGEKEEQ
jgi:hypothetical protein